MVKARFETYKCNVCGNIVEVMHVGGGPLVCCGEPMEFLTENSKEASLEKHVPVIEKIATGFKIKVGSMPHPMEDAHYIEWIEVQADGKDYHTFIEPSDAPEAEFCIQAESVSARIYCNLHGLWKSA
jgi:superoxide reductase